jgi:uracil-DNA glycosylase family 4
MSGNHQSVLPAELLTLHQQLRACRRCEEAGLITAARPVVVDGGRVGGIMLIGQAPGSVEYERGRPFAGRAGRELFRWLARIGIEEAEFRERVYISAITRCFPGKNAKGGGDRRPSRREIELCRPWLEAQLAIIRPRAILLVGSLAIERYFPKQPLNALIGQRFERAGTILIPLPHPSGASRWLNETAHRALLDRALTHVQEVWQCFA